MSHCGWASAAGLAQEPAHCRYTCRPVYAVIKTGGKQERVEEGQRLDVELLGSPEGEEVSFAAAVGGRRRDCARDAG